MTFLPAAPSAGFSSGAKQERIPKPGLCSSTLLRWLHTHGNHASLPHQKYTDGGQEVISARFVHPREALREFQAGKITFMPPQFYILITLCDILQGSQNNEEQRAQVATLSQCAFGRMILNPRPCKPEGDDLAKGYSILTYEGDETRGGCKGRLHRAKLRTVDGVSK